MPTEGGQEGLPGSVRQEQMSAERTLDQGQSGVPQQEVSSAQGLSKVTSVLRSIVNIIRGKHEQSGTVDPNNLNPFRKEPPQSPPIQTPSNEPSQS